LDEQDEFWLSEEMAEWLGLKKSEYLSKLIENQRADDYVFEEFIRYEKLVPDTIQHPDRVYERVEDDQRVRTYVRTYEDKLHQIVVGALIADTKSGNDVFVPIINFITNSIELAQLFGQGESSGPLRN